MLGGNGFVGAGIAEAAKESGIYNIVVINRDNYNDYVGTKCDVFINANGNSKKYLANQEPLHDFKLSVESVYSSLYDFEFSKYIYLSSSEVYNDASSPLTTSEEVTIDSSKLSKYGFHKYLSEEIVKNTCKSWLIIRQSGFVGKGLKKNPIFDLVNGQKLWISPLSELQYINTIDSGRIILSLIESSISNQIFNVSSEGVIKISDIKFDLTGEFNDHQSLPIVRCEINISKIKSLFKIPTTSKTLEDFLKNDNN